MKPYSFHLLFSLVAASASAQFIAPDYRTGDNDENFAYWLGFDAPYTPEDPPYDGLDDLQVNYPYEGGNENARLGQYAVSDAIITSTLGIYTFGEDPAAYKVYDNPDYSPGDILFQTMTLTGSDSIPDVSTVKLFYRATEGGAWVQADISLAAAVISSDSVGNQFTAWEWDTSSLLISDYYIQFSYGLSHSSFIEAQLDTNETFDLQIDGLGLTIESNIPFGLLYGIVQKTPEKLVYNPGEEVILDYTSNGLFQFVKWVGPFGESTENPTTFTITENTEIQLVLASKNYTTWRQTAFASNHGGDITPADWAADNDYELDGRINALEYALNSDPESGILYNERVQLVTVDVEGVLYPAIEFPQQIAATDLTYSVSVSADLSTWFTNGDAGGPYTTEPEILYLGDNGEQQVRVRSLTPLDALSPLPFIQLNIHYED